MTGGQILDLMLWSVARQAAWVCSNNREPDEGEQLSPLCKSLQRCKTLTHLALLMSGVGGESITYVYQV